MTLDDHCACAQGLRATSSIPLKSVLKRAPRHHSHPPDQAWGSSCKITFSFPSDSATCQVPLSQECPLQVATDMFSMYHTAGGWGFHNTMSIFKSKEANVIAVTLRTHRTCFLTAPVSQIYNYREKIWTDSWSRPGPCACLGLTQMYHSRPNSNNSVASKDCPSQDLLIISPGCWFP